jgi:hypothetical protein
MPPTCAPIHMARRGLIGAQRHRLETGASIRVNPHAFGKSDRIREIPMDRWTPGIRPKPRSRGRAAGGLASTRLRGSHGRRSHVLVDPGASPLGNCDLNPPLASRPRGSGEVRPGIAANPLIPLVVGPTPARVESIRSRRDGRGPFPGDQPNWRCHRVPEPVPPLAGPVSMRNPKLDSNPARSLGESPRRRARLC